ncbi:16S rRNA methyltransferase [Massilia sp. WF1]|uniref:16S rRNA (uracil(1498)-N(3))-methyltransferase n=1 Tax=unclassified Massilia TaxID=2609279 RepID=UPI0006495AED|nr:MULTISPECIES: 16S rRNA (uracil(1498)-N(3))-methyltransferase [unclassified Massilia]ALK96001.1 16S rRNA methyltransferase [Massilia sp. WG5]KLU37417.1 16S rRNA methyltransferase [Massilia sp. WF1]
MPRFYCPQPLLAGAIVDLPDSVAHHLHVVRQQPGDEVVLFNGEGGQARARLREIGKRRASAEVVAVEAVDVELPYAVTLAQGLPEGSSKMDWIVEKAVELGVSSIQPLAAARSVVKLSGERADKRQAHWEGVIIAASEQSGRNRLARLAPLQDFGRWIAQPAQEPRILLSPRATQSLAGWARATRPQAVSFVIGPEGGFSPQEEEMALTHGALALSMGPRVLRTETAGLAALATLNAVWAAD